MENKIKKKTIKTHSDFFSSPQWSVNKQIEAGFIYPNIRTGTTAI